MQKNVVISVKGIQKYDNMESDTVELVTEGQLQRENGVYILTYLESEITGLDGTQTTITVQEDQVTLVRAGQYNSQMVFQEGRRHLSMYNTPYGALAIGVNTLSLMTDLTDEGGIIEVDYETEVEHAVAGRNLFHIEIKESQGESLKK